ncbi:MAG: histidine triad nucleotide-binding protein [Candidatus Marinimicrobia bacterium]|nr:histidine triad nucleotide-binding protein [Candidatus Neomarinimicrobiota bacterium]RKY60995.1 MAG: histidine triad nucleotide-binding protein [Candidatus Neomarinimicrobiota bacterium]
MNNDCIFCKIAAGEFGTKFLFEDEDLLAFRDINPQAPVHVLIIPRKHIARINQLQDNHRELAGKMILLANRLAVEEGISDEGYRLVFNCGPDGGQEVEHIHLHLIGGRQMTWPPG